MKTTGHKVADLDLINESMLAMEGVEQLLAVAAYSHSQLNEVHADNLCTLLYVIRDRMRRGIEGMSVDEVTAAVELADDAGMREIPESEKLADDLAQALGDRVVADMASGRQFKGYRVIQGRLIPEYE